MDFIVDKKHENGQKEEGSKEYIGCFLVSGFPVGQTAYKTAQKEGGRG